MRGLAAIVTCLLVAQAAAWTYEASGSDWSGLCKNGTRQSPINFQVESLQKTTAVTDQDAAWNRRIRFAYNKPANVVMKNTGHAIEVDGNDFGAVQIRHTVLNEDRTSMSHQWQTYDVKQFHFHSPSEHTINGKRFDLEMHVVHQRRGASGTEGLAVVGVIFDTMGKKEEKKDTAAPKQQQQSAPESKGVFGHDDWGMEEDEASGEAFIQLWSRLLKNSSGSDPFLTGVQLASAPQYKGNTRALTNTPSLTDLNSTFNGPFYYYSGSLTTPPCAEWVRWHVFPRVHEMAPEQLSAIKKAFSAGEGHSAKGNFRAVQSLNDRKVYLRPSVAALNQPSSSNSTKNQPSSSNSTKTVTAPSSNTTTTKSEDKTDTTKSEDKKATVNNTTTDATSKSEDKKDANNDTTSKSEDKKEVNNTTTTKTEDKKEAAASSEKKEESAKNAADKTAKAEDKTSTSTK